MIIACIGDSLTEGDYGIKGKTGIANVQKESYPYFLSLLMGCEVRNFGKCGYRSSTYLKYYKDGNAPVADADIILVMLGTNGGQSAEDTSEENACYRELISLLRADAPKAHIYLMTPPNATVDPAYSNCGYMAQVLEAQAFTRKVAEETGLPLIDIAKNRCFTPRWEYIMQPNDGLHMGFKGYARMAEDIYSHISKFRKAPLTTRKLSGVPADFPLVAHRGLSGIECENTCLSYSAAGNRGYYAIETDIWRTKDGKFICAHDPSTGRICKEDYVIEETDFDTLRALTLNDVDRETPCYALRLPTPEEYVRTCKKYGKHCVTEFKSEFTTDEIREILDIFVKEDYLEHTTFIGVSMDNLDKVRAFYPNQSCQFLTGFWNLRPDWVNTMGDLLTEHKMDLDTDWFVIDKESVEALHKRGIKVNVWTVDNTVLADYLVDCGVDFITTNLMEIK